MNYHLLMDKTTANILIQANNRFYAEQAVSFGKTRNNSWPGWQRVLEAAGLTADNTLPRQPISVLDLACGNKRFEAFLEQRLTEAAFQFHTVDNAPFEDCNDLRSPVTHLQLDVLSTLMQEEELSLGADHDLSVSFGFMHHVPGQTMRAQTLRALIQATAPGGHVALSFWRFLDSPSLAQQAHDALEPACAALALDPAQLDEGDAFLGWDGKPDVWRYCHSFCDTEIDQLVAECKDIADVIDRFRSDGRGQNLNEYVVLRRR